MVRPLAPRLRVAAILLATGGSVLAVSLSCGPGDLSALTRGRADAGTIPTGDGCTHAVPPEKPTSEDQGPSIAGLVFAADRLRLDNGDYTDDAGAPLDAGLPKPLSLDLDGKCSCPGPETCVPQDSQKCDGEGGRDNSAGEFIAGLAKLFPGFNPLTVVQNIQGGQFTLLISVQNYNGKANDGNVLVNVLAASGMDGPDGGPKPRPKFDGTDVWSVDPNSIVSGDDYQGRLCSEVSCVGSVDAAAYVKDNVLVARLDSLPVTINTDTGSFVLPITNLVLSARIAQENGTWRLSGELSGRMTTDGLLKSALALTDPATGNSLCSTTTYKLFKSLVCAFADIATTPEEDNTGARCGALSESMIFTASPAKLGTVKLKEPVTSGCPNFVDRCP